MKFIQVFNRYLEPGGEETSADRIARHLELGGHSVVRFWRASSEWRRPGAPTRLQQLTRMWRNPAVLGELRELHRREKPQAWILHNVVPVISLGVYRLAQGLGVPIIQWLHNYRPLSPSGTLSAGGYQLQPEDPWIRLKETLAGSWRGRFLTAWLSIGYALCRSRGDFESVRAWIAVSEEMRRMFERANWPRDRLFALRHSWDIQNPSQLGPDEGYFLFLGRMIERKGVRFLVELWRRSALQGIPLVLAGEGELYDELRQQTFHDIRCVGYVRGDEKRRAVARCRAILFPSLWQEPLSTVAYEGYEQGKPILSSKLGGMNELVLNGETGRLLEAGDADAWQNAIVEFYRDAELSQKMGANGRRWLEANVSPAGWNSQFNAIAQHILRAG